MEKRVWYNREVPQILHILRSNENGLTEKTALHRMEKYGRNKLPEAKMDSLAIIFLRQFQSPLIYILFLASVIVFLMEEYIDGSIILFVLLFNAIVGTFQEGKAQNTLAALKNFVSTNATVLRDGQESIIPDAEIVVGDIIILQEGEKAPADCRIIFSSNLKVDEAMLTGESKAVEKNSALIEAPLTPIAEQKNMVFKGTNIATGNGKAIVTAIGLDTEIGRISQAISSIDKEIPLKANLEYLSKIVVYGVVTVNFLLLFLGMAMGKSFREMFTTVISMAVSVIPEGLPIVMTLVLAIGVSRMSKKNVLVKKLQAVEALGQVNIIAVDKTGTLTKNEMVVEKIFTNGKLYAVTGTGYSPKGLIIGPDKAILKHNPADIELAAKMAAFCSGARISYIEKTKEWKVAGDPTEAALLVFAEKAGIKKDHLLAANPLIKDLPFDYFKKYHATINQAGKSFLVSAVGAPEAILNLIDTTQEERQKLENIFKDLSREGLRTIAFAYKESKAADPEISALNFGGFYCMKDALREEVKQAVKSAKHAGVRLVMITGDHKITAGAIAREAGIYQEGDDIITGEEVDRMSDEELAYKIGKASVFSRVTPEHKLRIIKAFKKNNVIAMTGDGVNDAPSLVAADIGVSMGRIGTEVAKEASDIILLDDNFGNIISGLKEGRNMYHSIKRVILYLFSTNTGEVLTLVVSVALGMPLPLLAAQIIWLNLISDSFMDVALSMEPRDKNITKGKFAKPKKYIIDSLMGWRIFLMSVPMMIGTLFIFSRYIPEAGGDFSKAWTVSLTTLAVFHWFNAWNCRSERKSIFSMNPFSNKFLLAALAIVITLQLFAIYHPFLQGILRTAPLAADDWLYIALVASSIIVVEEVRKIFLRRMAE